ncbi:sigma-70 family RNA polymerase sigma factor [Paenibacillus paeoniae]|uniref:Sigma-70 family RNA polymerase sigma factor n=2 Tax=Paenibacillus paeoniae TaxID=2292705 RepID=A0A371P7Y5_9BACL|nr:sigma-70 family RNA polymerase sigma factor [Paenibacillus paeoniae]
MDKTELYNLMTQYGDDVRKYAYAMTRNREQSKDIAQEVFIKVYQNIGSFRGQSSFKTWLFTIVRNLAINELRSSYMRRIVLFEWVRSDRTAGSAEAVYLEEQSEKELLDIVLGLSMKHREVLVLHLEHGMTKAEIGQLLNLSEGTVKSRLHRARKIVESKWKEMKR